MGLKRLKGGGGGGAQGGASWKPRAMLVQGRARAAGAWDHVLLDIIKFARFSGTPEGHVESQIPLRVAKASLGSWGPRGSAPVGLAQFPQLSGAP